MKHIFILILSISLFASCGQSEKEKEANEVLKQDSIKKSEEFRKDSVEAQIYHTDSIRRAQQASNDSIKHAQAATEATIRAMERNLEDINSQLVAANYKLQQIGQFKFGRSQKEKDDEIQNQSKLIFVLRDSAMNIRNRIQALQK